MKIGFLCLGVALGLTIAGCQTANPRLRGLAPSPEQKAKLQDELAIANSFLAEGNADSALASFQAFRDRHPETIYDAEARFGEGRAYELKKDWLSAQKVYRELITERVGTQPQIATFATFSQSRVYEALGDNAQMMASLLDAKMQSDKLPEEIRVAALPARLALASVRLGQLSDAKKYRHEADRGIDKIRVSLKPDQYAELYAQMGSLSTDSVRPESFQAYINALESSQVYLLQAIEQGVHPTSDRVRDELEKHYEDLWIIAMNPVVDQALDDQASQRKRVEVRNHQVSEILRLGNQLRQNSRPIESQPSAQESEFFGFLKQIEDQGQKVLASPDTVIPLTPEAKKRRGLKRRGTIRQDEKTLPVTAPLKQQDDPNLLPTGDAHP